MFDFLSVLSPLQTVYIDYPSVVSGHPSLLSIPEFAIGKFETRIRFRFAKGFGEATQSLHHAKRTIDPLGSTGLHHLIEIVRFLNFMFA